MHPLRTVCFVVVLAAFSASLAMANGELSPMEQLGKEIYFDKISEPGNMACADCHAPSVGFTGPIPGVNRFDAIYPGAIPQRAGNRKPPSASYATFAPIFHFDAGEGLFIGGNFWDGRATGERLGNPAADQALGPFLNPVEQNMPSKAAVLAKIASSQYAWLWEVVWGEPLMYDTPLQTEINYDRVGLAVAAFEASHEVNPFSSKFDTFWRNANNASMDVTAIDMTNWTAYGDLGLNKKELQGLALFNDESKGMCALCHVLDSVEGLPPLLTDFSFDNLGVPKNPYNPFYDMDEVYLDNGDPINPLGDAWVDPGLGGFLANHGNPAWQAMAAENMGKHKVPSLRNVDKRPSEEFAKAYMHNGVFKSLREVVHFYNTRDVESWPPPEVADNVNTDELGDLGLNKKEEGLIVEFMKTLSDGWLPDKDESAVAAATMDFADPNPFNPSTIIAFNLPTAGNVGMHVYDVKGRRVATLIDSWTAAGDHTVAFTAHDMPSGVYFLRMTSASGVVTKKMVVVK
jgi:cytochrome c peroxidase